MSWNVESFMTYCIQNIPNLKWPNVIKMLDKPNLTFTSM